MPRGQTTWELLPSGKSLQIFFNHLGKKMGYLSGPPSLFSASNPELQ